MTINMSKIKELILILSYKPCIKHLTAPFDFRNQEVYITNYILFSLINFVQMSSGSI